VNARSIWVRVTCAFAVACSFACDKVPDVNAEPDTKPENTGMPERIVFVSDRESGMNRQIYTMRIDGSDRTRISHDTIDYINPVYSPGGETILSNSNTPDGSNEIYLMNADGSNMRNLSHSRGDDNFADYSPDGSHIIFTSTRDGNSELYSMDSDGGNQRRLTFSDQMDHSARYTPDGLRIVFCATKVEAVGSYGPESDVYIMNSDGSNKTCLTEEGSCHFYVPFLGRSSWFMQHNLYPSISSDGSKILFSSYDPRSDCNWVVIMDVDGKNRRVVYAADLACAPVFAPGDSMIIFHTHRDGKYDLYEMALNGTRQRKLTKGTPGHVIFSQFSPDGSAMLFSTDVGSYALGSFQTIWTMNRNGSFQTQLTFGGGNDEFPHFKPVRK
jgi:Tol biopolymer transport system component